MKLIRFLLVMAGTSAMALAQTNTPISNSSTNARVLSLQDCIALALGENLDIQIQRVDTTRYVYLLRAAYSGYDSTLTLQGQHLRNEAGSQILSGGFTIPGSTTEADIFNADLAGLTPWGMKYDLQGNMNDTTVFDSPTFSSTHGSASATITQPLLKDFWIDQTRLQIRQSKNNVSINQQQLRFQLIQTITQLEQAYYDLIYDRENVEVQQKAFDAAERLVVENQKKVDVGSLAPLDLLSSQSQAEISRAAVQTAQATLAGGEANLKQLITSKYSQWATLLIEPSEKLYAQREFFSLQDSWTKGLSLRPEMVQAKLNLANAGIQVKYDKNQIYPELDAFGTYGFNGSGQEFSDALYDVQKGDRPFYSYGGKLIVPLGNVSARNTYHSDKLLLEEAVLKVKKLERDIMRAIDNDIAQARSSYEQTMSTRKGREFAEADMAAEQKKLDSGKSTPYLVLLKLRDLTTARGQEILALDNYMKSLSTLSQDEGNTLNRLNITVEMAPSR